MDWDVRIRWPIKMQSLRAFAKATEELESEKESLTRPLKLASD